jgi:hypothetical protein
VPHRACRFCREPENLRAALFFEELSHSRYRVGVVVYVYVVVDPERGGRVSVTDTP